MIGDEPLSTDAGPLLADGGPQRQISDAELVAHLDRLVDDHVPTGGRRRVLLVPPDQTRLHSRAGRITALLHRRLVDAGVEVAVLPAVGTHAPMSPEDVARMFGPDLPADRLLWHRWRDGVVPLGQIDAAEVRELSGGRLDLAIPVEADELLVGGQWDLVISIGQVLPHEVIGMANFTKNLVIGLGGAPTIHRSHFLGAVCNLETIMGRADTPVRAVVDRAFDRFLAPRLRVLWVLTVMEDTPAGVVQRGLFVGEGGTAGSGSAAYQAAARLAAAVNVTVVPEGFDRVAAWLDPAELRTTWVGNKAVYRTRMAVNDGGELLVLAPGVTRFGEDPLLDGLIRRHGYRGTPATFEALAADPELADNLGAAAHLIHGSSEGRFRITYCTDPAKGGLTRDEVESVGYSWRCLPDVLDALAITEATADGPHLDRCGEPYHLIRNPALGLWTRRPLVA